MILNEPYYEININGISLYTDKKDFLNALLNADVINQKKLPMKMSLDTSEIRVYYNTNSKKRLVWGIGQCLSDFDITPLEDAILDLLSKGDQLKEISRKRNIAVSTVQFHLIQIRKKFKVKTTIAAVSKYIIQKYKTI